MPDLNIFGTLSRLRVMENPLF